MKIHGKNWCWSSNTFVTWCEEPTHWKRYWCWERLKAKEGGDRGWDGWMASLTQWTWVWANSGRQWWIGKPRVLQSMGLQRVGHDWENNNIFCYFMCLSGLILWNKWTSLFFNNQSICLFWNVQEESHNHCHSPALEYIFDVKCWKHILAIERKNVAQMRPDTK